MGNQELLITLRDIAFLLEKSRKHGESGEYETHAARANAYILLCRLIDKFGIDGEIEYFDTLKQAKIWCEKEAVSGGVAA